MSLKSMCEVNNWGIGTKLRKTNKRGETMDVEITGFGEKAVLVKYTSERIEGECILHYTEGDTYQPLYSKDQALVEIDTLTAEIEERMTRLNFLVKQLSKPEEP